MLFRRTPVILQAAAAAAASGAGGSAGAPPKMPLKSAAEYLTMPTQELEALLATRKDQASELRALHEKSHMGVEYIHRRQMLDWEEHGVHYAQAASNMTGDMLFETRWMHESVRKKDDNEDRDRYLAGWIMLIATVFYWWWLTKHYRERPDAPKGRMQSNIVAWGYFPFSYAGGHTTWTARDIPTAWEAERNRKTVMRENRKFPRALEEELPTPLPTPPPIATGDDTAAVSAAAAAGAGGEARA